jgi:K+-sensing histidine kinase KdpD
MLNPFFTTKPTGEGTGLGLSIRHDVIVKQPGEFIKVDTQPGEFTEFRLVLPHTAATFTIEKFELVIMPKPPECLGSTCQRNYLRGLRR